MLALLVVSMAFQLGSRTPDVRDPFVSASMSALPSTPVLERAPPPAPPSADEGEGGGGDEGGEFLRLLSTAEQKEVLNDWIHRTRIYKMTDNLKLSEAHAGSLTELEDLSSLVNPRSKPFLACNRLLTSSPISAITTAPVQDFETYGPDGRRMLLGLFDASQLWAIAFAEVSRADGLKVSTLCVYPAELNDPGSTAKLRLVHALHVCSHNRTSQCYHCI